MTQVRLKRGCWIALFCTVLCSSYLYGQVITGTVLGVVSDASGGVVARARITVHNTGTNIDTKAKTNSSGEYVVPLLPTGTYDVLIEADGFKSYRQVGV